MRGSVTTGVRRKVFEMNYGYLKVRCAFYSGTLKMIG